MGECNGRSLGMRPMIMYSWYFRPSLIPYFSVIWHFYLTTQSSWKKLGVTCQTLPSLPHPLPLPHHPLPPRSATPSTASSVKPHPHLISFVKQRKIVQLALSAPWTSWTPTPQLLLSYMKKVKMQYRLVLLTACRGWLTQLRQKMQPFLFLNLREEHLSSTRLCQLDEDALIYRLLSKN